MAIKNLGRVVGKSAYEIWLEQGNTGTEEEFLESLKGDKNLDVYSKSETLVGTWINGKPLYRKVMEVETPTTTADGTNVDVQVHIRPGYYDVEDFFVEFCYIHDPSNTIVPLPYITNAGYQTKVTAGGGQVKVINGVSYYNGCPTIVSVLYTKTTD